MPVYIPCLNVQRQDDGAGFQVSIGGAGASSGGEGGGTSILPSVDITHSDSPVTLKIVPVFPFVTFGPNLAFWSNLFGLGQTKIERQKIEIQDFYTPIFQYLNRAYGVPIRDNHALQFDSDAVRALLRQNPAIGALQSVFTSQADAIVTGAFGYDKSGAGIRQRIVNQFLANAAYNAWPAGAVQQIWDGILESSVEACWQDRLRWQRDPLFLIHAARMAVLLQYVPMEWLVAASLTNGLIDALSREILLYWDQHQELIADIPKPTTPPDWAAQFVSWPHSLTLPIGDIRRLPYDARPQVLELYAGVSVPTPRYPDFLVGAQAPTQLPTPQEPTPPPVDQAPSPPPPPVLEIPPIGSGQGRALTPGQVLELPVFKVGDSYFQVPPPNWQVLEIPAVNRQEPLPQPPPECPPFPQTPYCPPPTQPQTPTPLPPDQDDPEFPGQGQPRGCPPECQQQIELLQRQQQECCDQTTYVVIPRLDYLTDWVVDLERRVPGPPPAPGPQLPPRPPGQGPFPTPEEPPPVVEIPPPAEPPPFPPDVIDCLTKLCDPATFCDKVRECERKLECAEYHLCTDRGGPWGPMGECWLDARTRAPANIKGVLDYPAPIATLASLFLAASQGQGTETPMDRTALLGSEFAAATQQESPQIVMVDAVTLISGAKILPDPDEEGADTIKYRTLALREGEVDPCANRQ